MGGAAAMKTQQAQAAAKAKIRTVGGGHLQGGKVNAKGVTGKATVAGQLHLTNHHSTAQLRSCGDVLDLNVTNTGGAGAVGSSSQHGSQPSIEASSIEASSHLKGGKVKSYQSPYSQHKSASKQKV